MKNLIFAFLYVYDNLFIFSKLLTIDNSLLRISDIVRHVVFLTIISVVADRVVSSAYIIKSNILDE